MSIFAIAAGREQFLEGGEQNSNLFSLEDIYPS